MERFQELDKERAAIDAEIQLIAEELTSGPNPIGLKGPLVDEEGFPRSDIDVYTVRHKRHRFACLQNDLKWKMKEIEDVMTSIYAEQKAQQPPTLKQPNSTAKGTLSHSTVHAIEANKGTALPVKLLGNSGVDSAIPFARVESIQDGSPSSEAGLQVGDLILQFGTAKAENHRELAAIRDIVGRNINTTIEVIVQRQPTADLYLLSLVPHSWNGPGVLGCHIVPLHV
ncbi:hypothetical protein H310_14601 [Aphanomyces invadans]|uniref:PDZ domain-containing protein n=1 Tax=Aphanomyces invadans TaxID=157072 RepID=A0A024T9B6_9STRA|nr:hypothetical protein H310_14601 [Aphanomyces invadans]ETV90643.1 hypothetical protein H310_14601 [Aphanomyces invadans]|eukprot:XP_008880713.1 hypothetical protein H310_14601 [Aphanomyces invadans]